VSFSAPFKTAILTAFLIESDGDNFFSDFLILSPSLIYFMSSFLSALLISTVFTALVAESFAAAATAALNSAYV